MRERVSLRQDEADLVAQAQQVRLAAHAPYSGFRVGAALRLVDGRVFVGCNVENASLGAAICAERSALVQAVAAGARPGAVAALAVYTTASAPTPPCGMCLQCLVEFASDLPILLAGPKRVERTNLAALLPRPFRSFPKRGTPGGRGPGERRRRAEP